MKFYSELKCDETVLIGDGLITFKNGEYETKEFKEIEVLQKFYKFEDVVVSAETEQATEEMTKAQIVEQLKAKGVEFDARQNKETLLELLKVGE